MKKKVPFLFGAMALLVLAGCGSQARPASDPATASASPAASGQQVIITLADNTITASQTSFQAGVQYTFVITNQGNHTHNFNISTPVSAAGSFNAAQAGALLSVPEEKLRPGSSVTMSYTFPASTAGAQLEFACLIQRHYEDGMRLAITVTK